MPDALADKVKPFSLGFWPTPLHRLDRLSAELGAEIWMKRDDLSGLATGGNKVRKLEYLLGAAVAAGADCVVTGGAAQSNHSRQTAAAAARAGLECHLALGGEAPKTVAGNLLLDRIFGARLYWCGEDRKGERIDEIMDTLKEDGRRPWKIPYGGSDPVGARGFVAAARELAEQLRERGLARVEVVFASSSGGTHAGLLAGAASCGLDARFTGMLVDPADVGVADARIRALARALGCADPQIVLDGRSLSGGYGEVTGTDAEAIHRLARTEGILLDPVYTGRSFAGLLARIEAGESAGPVVFWHTGGLPALFVPEVARQLR